MAHLDVLELEELHHVGVAHHAKHSANDVRAAVAVVKQLLQGRQSAARVVRWVDNPRPYMLSLSRLQQPQRAGQA